VLGLLRRLEGQRLPWNAGTRHRRRIMAPVTLEKS
jgi:hypothetical protein